MTSATADDPAHEYFTTSDGIKIHYMTLGSAGSWVVLIHGYSGSAEGNWFRNGIAEALAARHRVAAIDNRNHGRSDRPQPRGPGKAEDVIEMMDHIGIGAAHIHGYSMGGGITGRLLASSPGRFISAGFGGSGIREVDSEWIDKVPPDPEGRDPQEAEASRNLRIAAAMNSGMSREKAERLADQPREPRQGISEEARAAARRGLEIDLTKVMIPVLAINGEFDRPFSKTHRMWRELRNFTSRTSRRLRHRTCLGSTLKM